MTQTDIYLSVIVPVYNEANRLFKTLRRLQQYLASESFSYETLIVLDGPTDGTVEIIQQLSKEITHLRVIGRSFNRGKGYSVKEGMLAARRSEEHTSELQSPTNLVCRLL